MACKQPTTYNKRCDCLDPFTKAHKSKHMSKTRKDSEDKRSHRNHVAMGMIISGTGHKQIFADRRNKRSKDARKRREMMQEEGYTLIEGLATLVALAFWICIGYHFITKFW